MTSRWDVLKRLVDGDSLATKASYGERPQVSAAWDSPYVPAVRDDLLMSDAPRGQSKTACFPLGVLVSRLFLHHNDRCMRIYAQSLAR